jgi:hypothetical protein
MADYLRGTNESGRLQPGAGRKHFQIGFGQDTKNIAGAPAYFAVSPAVGTSMSSLRITRLVAFSVASSKP